MKIVIFVIFVIIPVLFLSRGMALTNVGDNITYILQAESLYYDHDFKVQHKDFARFDKRYPGIIKNLPIITKINKHGEITFAKPIFFTAYMALFTPILHPIYRAIVANLILLFIMYALCFHVVKEKKLWVMFCAILLCSQQYFYIPHMYPEIFINFLVVLSALPLIYKGGNKWIVFLAGFMGSILPFEKQFAVVFPLIALLHVLLQQRKDFKYYMSAFLIGCLFSLVINFMFHGNAIAYEGLRGHSYFDGASFYFSGGGVAKPFGFPLNYGMRFQEYFFGKNIGIFVYNAFSIFGVLALIISLRKKIRWKIVMLMLPVLLYVCAYFILVYQSVSYGGSTSIGNRYFFQIYCYVAIVGMYIISQLKGYAKKIALVFTGLVIMFSTFVYRPFYRTYQRAIQNHLLIVFNNTAFRYFPLELAYHNVLFEDLVTENKLRNIYIINGNRSVYQESPGKWLPEGETELVEVSIDGIFTLPQKIQNARLIKSYQLKYLKNRYGDYVGYFKVNCSKSTIGDSERCVYLE